MAEDERAVHNQPQVIALNFAPVEMEPVARIERNASKLNLWTVPP